MTEWQFDNMTEWQHDCMRRWPDHLTICDRMSIWEYDIVTKCLCVKMAVFTSYWRDERMTSERWVETPPTGDRRGNWHKIWIPNVIMGLGFSCKAASINRVQDSVQIISYKTASHCPCDHSPLHESHSLASCHAARVQGQSCNVDTGH